MTRDTPTIEQIERSIEIELGLYAFFAWAQGADSWDDLPCEPTCDACGTIAVDLTHTGTCEGIYLCRPCYHEAEPVA